MSRAERRHRVDDGASQEVEGASPEAQLPSETGGSLVSVIRTVTAWEALDSRGKPTVACRVTNRDGGCGSAVVPSGASTGQFEAHELRDGDPARFGGDGVRGAVAKIHQELGPAVRGMDAREWRAVDRRLEEVDGSANLERLGANAVLAVSLASCLAGAASAARPLYQHLGDGGPIELPRPMVNIVSGGAHAGDAIDIQDVLVVPTSARSFAEAIEQIWAVRHHTERLAAQRGLSSGLVADEGGLGLALRSNVEAFEIVLEGAENAGLTPGEDVWLAIDVAANRLREGDGYRLGLEDLKLTSLEMAGHVAGWCDQYPVLSVEDGLADDDEKGWQQLTSLIGDRVQVLGDDLFVTSAQRLEDGLNAGSANAILLKPNQAGTLERTERALMSSRRLDCRTVLSARSGETEDSWLADLAVAWRTGQIKVGSTTRSERTAKWNRLLDIEAHSAAESRLANPFPF